MAEETPPPVEEEPNKQAKKRRSRGNSEDRSRSQRLKTASAAGGRDTGDARNDALERENRTLRHQLSHPMPRSPVSASSSSDKTHCYAPSF